MQRNMNTILYNLNISIPTKKTFTEPLILKDFHFFFYNLMSLKNKKLINLNFNCLLDNKFHTEIFAVKYFIQKLYNEDYFETTFTDIELNIILNDQMFPELIDFDEILKNDLIIEDDLNIMEDIINYNNNPLYKSLSMKEDSIIEENIDENINYLPDVDIFFEKDTTSNFRTPNRKIYNNFPPNVKLERKNYLSNLKNDI